MILTARKLAEIGEQLYGPAWRARLAEKLERTERTIWVYEHKSDVVIPRRVRETLARLCRDQSAILADIAKELTSEKPEVD